VIVVSNTSPLLNLALVGQLDLLERLFEKVFVPDAVVSETAAFSAGTGMVLPLPPWVEKRSVTNRSLLDSLQLELDAGEGESIALAVELNADLVLLDERLARRIATGLGLKVAGLLGLLVEAKRRRLIVLVKPILDALMTRAGFWVGRDLYARVLAEVAE
jgi:hypothetical protein